MGVERCNYVGNQARASVTFIDWLEGLKSLDYFAIALRAGVLVLDVFDALEGGRNIFKLKRDIETNACSFDIAAWAREFRLNRNFMFLNFLYGSCLVCVSAATTVRIGRGRHPQFRFFCGDSCICFVVDFFAGSFDVIGRSLSRATAELIAPLSTRLFFENEYALLEPMNQRVAIGYFSRKRIWQCDSGGNVAGTGLSHFFFLAPFLLYSTVSTGFGTRKKK